MGGLLGGSDGQVGSNDLWGLGRGLVSAYMGDRQNKRYNEAMSPLFDLYKDQAADVAQRRANRDSNLANEWETNLALMQPGRDRRDQKAANLAQSQGVTQSSSNAWNKAENEQRREATDLYTRQKLANLYDTRTGMLGGQLSASGQQFTSPDYLTRQENPYLNWLQTGITGRPV